MLLHSSAASSEVSASDAVIEVFRHGDDRPIGFCRCITVGALLLMPGSKSMARAHNSMRKVAAMRFVLQQRPTQIDRVLLAYQWFLV